jgi:hypothetical protein
MQSAERRLWFAFAGLLFVVIAAWSFSQPLFSYPDESAHVTRAESVIRGEFVGRYDGYRQGPYVYPYYAVSVPGVLVHASQDGTCLALLVDQPASACPSGLTGSAHSVEVNTYVGTYPPPYYLLVGLPTLAWPGAVGIFLMRIIGAGINAAFLASALLSVLVARRGRVAAVGVLAAATPAVLYVSGAVNPAGLEITSAISLWAAGLAFVTIEAPQRTGQFVRRAGLAGSVLVWSRPSSPLWLACIVVSVFVLCDANRRHSLRRRRDFRAWSVIVGVLSAGAVAWDLGARAFQVMGNAEPPEKSNLTLLGEAFSHTWSWFQNAFGDFGAASNEMVPAVLVVLCVAVLTALLVAGWRAATRRQAIVLLGLLSTTFLVPVLITFVEDRRLGVFWQGRYVLPLAAGIPILSALLLANSERSEARIFARYSWAAYTALAGANVIGLLTTVHRFVDGTNGPLDLVGGKWQPPVNAVALIAVFAGAQALLSWTVYRVGGIEPRAQGDLSGPVAEAAALRHGKARHVVPRNVLDSHQ